MKMSWQLPKFVHQGMDVVLSQDSWSNVHVTFCTFPTISRSRSARSDAVDSADPEEEEGLSRQRNSKMASARLQSGGNRGRRREIFDRRRKRRNARARRKRWLPVEGWWTISPQPLRGGRTSTPLTNSHDATIPLIIVSLLPNNFKSRDALINFVIYFQVK